MDVSLSRLGAGTPSFLRGNINSRPSELGISGAELAKYYTKTKNTNGYDVAKYNFTLANNMSRSIIRNSMDDSQFNASIVQLKKAILDVGTSMSTMQEKGRCLLAYQLAKSAENGFFKKGDIGIVVLISDEDDASDGCESELVHTSKDNTSYEVITKYLYYKIATKQTYNIHYSWKRPCYEGTKLCAETGWWNWDACLTDSEFIAYNSWAGKAADFKIERCELIPASTSTNSQQVTTLTPDCPALLARIPGAYDCTPTDRSVTHYNSDGYSAVAMKYLTDDVPAGVPVDQKLNTYLLNQVKSIFGEANFYLAGIFNTGSCPVVGEQAKGLQYQKMIDFFKAQSVNVTTQAICSNDYASTLRSISKYAQKIVSTSYKISFDPENEMITEFIIRRDGKDIHLYPGKDYEISGSMVKFIDFELLASDELLINYEQKRPPGEEENRDPKSFVR